MGELLNFIDSVDMSAKLNLKDIKCVEANRKTVVGIIKEMNDMGLLMTSKVDVEKFLDKNNRIFYYDKTIKVNNTLENYGEFMFTTTYKPESTPEWIWISFAIYNSDEFVVTDSSEYSVVD